MPANRAEALSEILSLAQRYDIGADEITASMRREAVETHSPQAQTSLMKKLLAYLGGIFIFAGVCLLIGMLYPDLSKAQRVIITFGPGFAAFLLGLIVLKDQRYERASTPLFLVAALMEPTGMFVFLDEYFDGGNVDLAVTSVFAVLTVQQILAFLKFRRTSLLFFSIFFWYGTLCGLMSLLEIDNEYTALGLAISLIMITYSIDKTIHRAIAPFWYFWGSLITLVATWDIVHNTSFDLAYLGVNAFMIYLSIKCASRTMLFVSVIGLLGYLGYYTEKYFVDVIGWPVALIVLGFAMIGLSAYAIKLGHSIAATQKK